MINPDVPNHGGEPGERQTSSVKSKNRHTGVGDVLKRLGRFRFRLPYIRNRQDESFAQPALKLDVTNTITSPPAERSGPSHRSPLLDIKLQEVPKLDPATEQRINSIFETIVAKNPNLSTSTVRRFFGDHDLYRDFCNNLDDETLTDYIRNTVLFSDLLNTDRWSILGDRRTIPTATQANGRVREEQEGRLVLLDRVSAHGIDPAKVLMFRFTQPGGPKPEYFWTSDYTEAKGGLSQEIPPEQRVNGVVLVSTLETVNSNGGLIQDIQDDQGIAVRQISLTPFPQSKVLAIIKPSNH